MTRKHFEAIAKEIALSFAQSSLLYRQGAITIGEKVERDLALTGLYRHLSTTFQSFNPNFDAERFRKACNFR